MKEILLPKTIWGKKLPYGKDSKSKKARIKSYLIEAVIFMIAMTLFDIIALLVTHTRSVFMFVNNYTVNYILTILITAIILFSLSFSFDYIISEIAVKKYQKNNKVKQKV